MSFNIVSVPISRASSPLAGSPFDCRLYRKSSFTGRSAEVAPNITREQSAQVLSFVDTTAAVAVGDLATLPDGSLAKLINVRPYDTSLQADLQVIPYQTVTLYTQDAVAGRVDGSGNLADAHYTSAGAILAFLDPHMSHGDTTAIGMIDRRVVYAYTTQPLSVGSMLVAGGECWQVEGNSDVYPVTLDYRAIATLMPVKPAGIP